MTNPVSIRRIARDDVAHIYDAVMESRELLAPWMPWCHPAYAVSDAEEWVAKQLIAFPAGEEFAFAVLEGDRFAGVCGLNMIDTLNQRANLGYWIRASATGRGVATAAARLLVRWAFSETELERLEIVAAAGNLASIRVAEKVGASREGLLRARIRLDGRSNDAVMFSILRSDSPV